MINWTDPDETNIRRDEKNISIKKGTTNIYTRNATERKNIEVTESVNINEAKEKMNIGKVTRKQN